MKKCRGVMNTLLIGDRSCLADQTSRHTGSYFSLFLAQREVFKRRIAADGPLTSPFTAIVVIFPAPARTFRLR
jgi:hypothetical protein